MAHPYAQHAEHKKGHTRVKHVLGSGDAGHTDAAADKQLFSKLIAAHEQGEAKVEGQKDAARFARGGRTKHKGSQTNIAIVVPQKGSSPGSDGPQAGPVAAGPAPPMPPPGGPPPAGGPPGMPPMRASGGRVGGDASKKNLKGWSAHAKGHSYARGGRLPAAGAESGVGRLQKAKK